MGHCASCIHHDRAEIDRLILEGERYTKIAEHVGGLSDSAIARHAQNHMGQPLRPQRYRMETRCIVCTHPDRPQIEAMLTGQRGEYAAAARAFGLKQWHVGKHAINHLRATPKDGGVCKSCASPERSTIDSLIRAGVAHHVIGERFGMSQGAVSKHARNHLGIWNNVCGVCSHPSAALIDVAILSGEPYVVIEQTYGLGTNVPAAHAQNHLGVQPNRSAANARRCNICSHPEAEALCEELANAQRRVKGKCVADILRRYGLNPKAAAKHLAPTHQAVLAVAAVERLAAVQDYVA